MTASWRFAFLPTPALPPLAWIARVRPALVEVRCGAAVRCSDTAFFEGTWVGAPGIESIIYSTTVFGSGMVADADGLHIVPPAHNLEGIYYARQRDELVVCNSLVALLSATGLELADEIDYPTRFRAGADGLDRSPIEVPTSGRPVHFAFFENLLVAPDTSLTVDRKLREAPFTSYSNYVGRLDEALASALVNAASYEPLMAVSSGYDSTAVAVLAGRHSCRHAVTFAEGRPLPGIATNDDSGAASATRLGMSVAVLDRLSYLERTDLPEAEFLASGMSGEDVTLLALEPYLDGRVLINGMVGGALWRKGRVARSDLMRGDLSGCSLAEFRLRVNFVYLPLPVFGMTEQPSVQAIAVSPEMAQFSVPGYYDQPVPRRIAEEGGIPRGSFATVKRTATSVIHLVGPALMAPASLAAATDFATAHGRQLHLRPRPRLARRERAVIHAAHRLGVPRLVRRLEQHRRSLMHFAPEPGSLLLRWAVEVIRPRYDAVRDLRPGTD